jgi:hypothetical protein
MKQLQKELQQLEPQITNKIMPEVISLIASSSKEEEQQVK